MNAFKYLVKYVLLLFYEQPISATAGPCWDTPSPQPLQIQDFINFLHTAFQVVHLHSSCW